MIINKRIIPTLLISNGKLVKTVNFGNKIYVGDPINAIKIFNDKEVDELILIDIDASKTKSQINYKLVEDCASECFMPLCYGGGIKNIDDATHLFSLGIEKICIQSSYFKDPNLLTELSSKYGSQAIVISIDLKKNIFGNYNIINSSNGSVIKKKLNDLLSELTELGAGEILMNVINKDGKMSGMDLEMINKIASNTSLPLIALGGVGSLNDIKNAFMNGASAVSAGSFFVFNGPHKAVLITYPKQNEITKIFKNI
jgi:cyclase